MSGCQKYRPSKQKKADILALREITGNTDIANWYTSFTSISQTAKPVFRLYELMHTGVMVMGLQVKTQINFLLFHIMK